MTRPSNGWAERGAEIIRRENADIRPYRPDPGCSECNDWFRNPLNPNPVTAFDPECPIRGTRCVKYAF